MEVEDPHYNNHGPKIVVSKQEYPVTICTADTIDKVKSRRLLLLLLDSGSTVSMIKKSAFLPKASKTLMQWETYSSSKLKMNLSVKIG